MLAEQFVWGVGKARVSRRHNRMWVVVMNEANVHALITLHYMELIFRLRDPVALPPGREDSQPDREPARQAARQTGWQADR